MKPPEYRARLGTGIVHFGPGAFHRAHQADYIDRLLHQDARWGIAAVSLRTRDTVDALKRQNGLYTLAILDTETSFRTIGAHGRFFGPEDSAAVRKQLLEAAVRIVSSTVTEKGYCLLGDGTLDFEHPDIVHDLERPLEPVSIIGCLALGLGDRRERQLPPFIPMCCDNMASNGKKLGAAVAAFARRLDPEFSRWIEGEVRFPDTMVDSITPAPDERLKKLVREHTGFDDAVPISREAYAEWVIQDVLTDQAPDLESVGVHLTSDVAAWEKAKLRILNGAHSTLAYLGLLIGHETVENAMADDRLSAFIERLISEDILPTLEPSPLDLRKYAEETLQRFRNPTVHHRLSQVAWDGSQKLPYRLLDTIIDARMAGASISRLAVPVAAWIRFLERQTRSGAQIVDPLAQQLTELASTSEPVRAILQLRQVFPEALASDAAFYTAVASARAQMERDGPESLISSEAALA